jgi:hypothetical protein
MSSKASFTVIDNSGDTTRAVSVNNEGFNPHNLDTFTACGIIEGFVETPQGVTDVDALQYLIDTGIVWTLQGFYGRLAKQAIDAGVCRIEQNATYYPAQPLPEFDNEF